MQTMTNWRMMVLLRLVSVSVGTMSSLARLSPCQTVTTRCGLPCDMVTNVSVRTCHPSHLCSHPHLPHSHLHLPHSHPHLPHPHSLTLTLISLTLTPSLSPSPPSLSPSPPSLSPPPTCSPPPPPPPPPAGGRPKEVHQERCKYIFEKQRDWHY